MYAAMFASGFVDDALRNMVPSVSEPLLQLVSAAIGRNFRGGVCMISECGLCGCFVCCRIFNHPNVLPVLGACNQPPNLVVISQLMPFSSLYNVLHGETGQLVCHCYPLDVLKTGFPQIWKVMESRGIEEVRESRGKVR